MDSLPPSPPAAVAASPAAPGDIFPRDDRERELCARASHPDWFYLGGLATLDAGTVWLGSNSEVKYSHNLLVRSSGPLLIGAAWGATLSGAYLALPKCSSEWIGETPREGRGRPSWPLALATALVAGATAPIVSVIAIGFCSADDPHSPPGLCQQGYIADQTTFEREMRLVIAGLAGFGGALLPYVLPPTTVTAARQLDRLRLGVDAHGGVVGYSLAF